LVGADVCGFGGDTTEELCTRWMELGAFYPFARNHNSAGSRSQEPYAFGQTLINASINALKLRYTLLPYFYTNFYYSHVTGSTVVRPLFFEFPMDPNTYSLDTQFLVGAAILVSPVTTSGATSVQAYFPKAIWYDWFTGAAASDGSEAATRTLQAPILTINVHLRGGYIIPTQQPALTTAVGRKSPFTLVAGLDTSGAAAGSLYLDDGESLDSVTMRKFTLISYQVLNGTLSNSIVANGFDGAGGLTVEAVKVYGLKTTPTQVTVNGATKSFSFSSAAKSLSVIGLSLGITSELRIRWM